MKMARDRDIPQFHQFFALSLAIFIGKTMINYQKLVWYLFSDSYTNVEFWYIAGYTDGVI